MRGISQWLSAMGAAALCVFSVSAHADLSDVWWSPAESGWGAYVTQQDENLILALLLYDKDGRPLHVTGGLRLRGYTNPGGLPFFQGDLYVATGPSYAGPFDPAQVTRRHVGQADFQAVSTSEADLFYTIDGHQVTRRISRLTAGLADIGGAYRHVTRIDIRTDAPGEPRVVAFDTGKLLIDQRGHAVTLRFEGQTIQCDYVGSYTQRGRYGEIDGRYTCNAGEESDFRITEVVKTSGALSGKFAALPGKQGFLRGSFTAVYTF